MRKEGKEVFLSGSLKILGGAKKLAPPRVSSVSAPDPI